jgi:hypothetical protein
VMAFNVAISADNIRHNGSSSYKIIIRSLVAGV